MEGQQRVNDDVQHISDCACTVFADLHQQSCKMAARLMRSADLVEEVLQEAALRIWRYLPAELEDAEAADRRRRWVLSVVRHAALDMLRRLRRRPSQPLSVLSREPRDRHDEEDAQRAGRDRWCERIRDWVEELRASEPEHYRLFYGHHYEKRPYEELAQSMGLTCRAVEGQLKRLRDRLGAWLRQQMEADAS
jgi:RNA polymerase sigma factor (sigma-70 family)